MVKLVKLKPKYLEKVRRWRNSPQVKKYMYTEPTITSQQQRRWYNRVRRDRTSKYWIILYLEQPVGLLNVTNIDYDNRHCCWGFYIAEQQALGKGVGQQAGRTVLDYIFTKLNLNKVYGDVFSFNKPSVRLHRKLGFRQEGTRLQHIFKSGQYYDVIIFGLLKSEWKSHPRRASMEATQTSIES